MYCNNNDWHDDVFRLTGREGLSYIRQCEPPAESHRATESRRFRIMILIFDTLYILCALRVSEKMQFARQ
jgi:hypothetical protein